MTPLFLFGTLRHAPLLKAVLGRTDHLQITRSNVRGFAVYAVAEGPFPLIVQEPEAKAEGMLVHGLTAGDLECLAFYEGAFGYELAPLTVQGGQSAQAYFAKTDAWSAAGPWSLGDWVRDWGALSVLAAREAMSYRGKKSAAEVGAMFGMIRARAWSRMNAAQSRHGALTLSGQVEVLAQRRAYAEYFALDDYEICHDRFDGTKSASVLRAVFLAPDATLVLPYDPKRDRVLLVEQVRMGPLARGDRALWQLEPIAGRLDPGEDAETAARREAMEEAGLEMGRLEPVAETYCSPGNSSEFYYIYVGLTDLPDGVAGIGGLAAEDEDIRSHVIGFDDLMSMCAALQIANAPLVMAAYWLAHHRGRLRAEAEADTGP